MAHPIKAVIFEMDGILVNSEPFWKAAGLKVFGSLAVSEELYQQLPDTIGLRIDQVVKLWVAAANISGCNETQLTRQIIGDVTEQIRLHKPLMPGVWEALRLCQSLGLKIALASASPMSMIKEVVTQFELHNHLITLSSAEGLPYSKPHPQVYLNAAAALNINPLHCLAIEDSVNGMIAALTTRMQVIAVPVGQQALLPVWGLARYKLASLQQLSAQMLVWPRPISCHG